MINGEGVRLHLEVAGDVASDSAALDEATLQLRRELLELDVADFGRPAGDAPPPATRAVEAALIGTLVITATRELVGADTRVVAGWRGRSSGRSVRLEIDGDTIDVTDPSAEDRNIRVCPDPQYWGKLASTGNFSTGESLAGAILRHRLGLS